MLLSFCETIIYIHRLLYGDLQKFNAYFESFLRAPKDNVISLYKVLSVVMVRLLDR
jgi:hypothetical protein